MCYIGERLYAIDKIPKFWDYLGYMFFCGGTIAGPFYEYKDYINFIQKKDDYSYIPNTILPTLKRIFHAICNKKVLINSFL